MHRIRHRRSFLHQRGTSLFEALVAFLVLALGMVAIARTQGTLRLDLDVARQRSEAVRLAQQELELVRGIRPFAQLASASHAVDAEVRFVIARQVVAVPPTNAKAASVTVDWTDRSGAARRYAIHSILEGSDPALVGALALVAASMPASAPAPAPPTAR
jgi:Tfp pilus assembly protein PilV